MDLVHGAADLTIAAHAPAMTPRPDVSWQAVALDARVQGPFTRPTVNGRLQLDQVSGGGGGVQRLVADVAGDQGLMRVHAAAEGLPVPALHRTCSRQRRSLWMPPLTSRPPTVLSNSRCGIRC